MTKALWLTFVLKQGATPLILIQAPDQGYFDSVRKGVSNLGFRPMTAGQFITGAWPAAPLAQVDVSREGLLLRVHLQTMDKSIVPSGEEPMTPIWMAAAKAMRKVLVAVVPPGSIDPDVAEEDLAGRLAQIAGHRIAGHRRLYAGLADFFDDRFHHRQPARAAA